MSAEATPPTAADVADWMREQFERSGELYQQDPAWGIEKRFGRSFLYENQHGNFAIRRDVLAEFRRLTEGTAVWSRGNLAWERRRRFHAPGTRMAD